MTAATRTLLGVLIAVVAITLLAAGYVSGVARQAAATDRMITARTSGEATIDISADCSAVRVDVAQPPSVSGIWARVSEAEEEGLGAAEMSAWAFPRTSEMVGTRSVQADKMLIHWGSPGTAADVREAMRSIEAQDVVDPAAGGVQSWLVLGARGDGSAAADVTVDLGRQEAVRPGTSTRDMPLCSWESVNEGPDTAAHEVVLVRAEITDPFPRSRPFVAMVRAHRMTLLGDDGSRFASVQHAYPSLSLVAGGGDES